MIIAPGITFWTARDAETGELLGGGALKQHEQRVPDARGVTRCDAVGARGQLDQPRASEIRAID
jgi:hypothetical protein